MTGQEDIKIKTGVIGYPVSHSLSPLIHNYWINQYGFSGLYHAVEIIPDRFEESVRHMVDQGYAGFNVTIPFKERIIDFCETIDKTAQHIGAVNTVVVTQGGKLKGMNTDSYGFVENILQSGCNVDLAGASAFVLGAGGAARGVVHGLLLMGAKTIILTNRTREKAEKIAQNFPAVEIVDWEARAHAAKDMRLLVNTTALGMTGQPELDFDLQYLPKEAAVCDIVYKPLHTELLRRAKESGHPVITGIGMLLQQARPAFKEWFGVMPDITDELRHDVLGGLE